ncbi:phospholipid phosphatase 2-like isoform X1 [Galleria mellonella]|uniref:Phospholipid phosphatase 2-like isoform X1 n=2 Tax=Galleria mellonella TaxID=7137 RepID=A0A6J1X1W8_GALME|nr:phospholipid phosphatase 2-like isoform X1 [Galleria mellonella]
MVRTYKVVKCFRMPKRGAKVVPAQSTDGVFTIDMSSTSTIDIATVSEPRPPAPEEMQARHSLWWHLVLDLPILLLVCAVCILLEVGALPSRRSGFMCHDPALSFAYTGDTFSISLVVAVTIIVPFIVMWAVETIHHRHDEYNMKTNKLVASAKTAGLIYRDYIYGAVVVFTILEVVKCVIGSPRPTFFDLCEPDAEKTCKHSEFVTSYTCTSTKYSRYLKIDSARSFPSAHATMSIYCGLFVAWYLQRRAFSWHNRSVLIVPLVQTICLVYAAVCTLSRLTDHRHHWWDVLVGGLMGLLAVLYTILVLCKNFSQPAVVSTSDISSSDSNNHPSVRRLLPNESRTAMP